jgi:uncharacterized protein
VNIGGETLKIEYDYTFGLPKNIIWKYIKDENVLRNSIPGCKSFIEKSKGVHQAELEINMGPIQDSFAMVIRLEEKKSADLYRLHVKGTGNIGEISGKADFYIREGVQGTARLHGRAEAQVTGALALAGQRFLENGANKSMETFFLKIEKEIKRTIYFLKRKSR